MLVTPLFVVKPLLFLFDNYLQMVHSALLGHGQRVLGVARMNELLCRLFTVKSCFFSQKRVELV